LIFNGLNIMRKQIIAIWKWIESHWYWCLFALLLGGLLIAYLIGIYTTVGFSQWSGFKDKTLWDVIDLAIIPLALVIIGYFFNKAERKSEYEINAQRVETERRISADQLQESALQTYLDRMTELMINNGLLKSELHSEVRVIARVRTLTLLDQLGGIRKTMVFKFLYEAGLISKDKPVINLKGANFREAVLHNITLLHIDLTEANLRKAILFFVGLPEANLVGIDFAEVSLASVDMRRADLRGANFTGATLFNTNFGGADLRGTLFVGNAPNAKSFEEIDKTGPVTAKFAFVDVRGAKYNNETKWPEDFNPKKEGAILLD
jgi:uncharacterized protein YjbI with pentapeptide repeats